MSTILKALRRLEEEKAASEEPRPLREQIASAPRSALRSRRSGWVAAALALVVGVGAGGGVIWWMFGNQSAAPAEVAAAAPPAPAPTAVPLPVPAAQPGPPEQAFESDVEIVERPDASLRLVETDPIEPSPIAPKPGSIRPVETSAAAERAREAALAEYDAAERARRGLPPELAAPSPPTPSEPIPVLPAQSVVAQAPTPVPAPPAPAPAPEIAAAQPAPEPAVRKAPPKEARPSEPAPPPAAPKIAVSVEKTQWHPLADRRIAWLRIPGESESRRVVEGDVIDGLLVAGIEPSGVVFERDGEKIRRALGR